MTLIWLPAAVLLTCVVPVTSNTVQCEIALKTAQCTKHLSNITEEDATNNIEKYCWAIGYYLGCFTYVWDIYCGPSLNREDFILPNMNDTFNDRCLENKTAACQAYLDAAGCYGHLANITNNTNVATSCNLMETYTGCVDREFAYCDQSLRKESFMDAGVITMHKEKCTGKTANCRRKLQTAGCHGHLTKINNNTDDRSTCALMGLYLRCFNQVFEECDQSLRKESFMEAWVDPKFKQMCPVKVPVTDSPESDANTLRAEMLTTFSGLFLVLLPRQL